MAIEVINNGDSGLVARTKINDNFNELKDKIDLTINFKDLSTFEFLMLQDYKIISVTEETGITATIKLGGTSTNYVLGDIVSGGNRLDITVDIIGAINIKGELI